MSSERFINVETTIKLVTVLDTQTGRALHEVQRTDAFEANGHKRQYQSSYTSQSENQNCALLDNIGKVITNTTDDSTKQLKSLVDREAEAEFSAASEVMLAAQQEEGRRRAAETIQTPAAPHFCSNRSIEMSELEQRARAGDLAAQEELSHQAVQAGLGRNKKRKEESAKGFSS